LTAELNMAQMQFEN